MNICNVNFVPSTWNSNLKFVVEKFYNWKCAHAPALFPRSCKTSRDLNPFRSAISISKRKNVPVKGFNTLFTENVSLQPVSFGSKQNSFTKFVKFSTSNLKRSVLLCIGAHFDDEKLVGKLLTRSTCVRVCMKMFERKQGTCMKKKRKNVIY